MKPQPDRTLFGKGYRIKGYCKNWIKLLRPDGKTFYLLDLKDHTCNCKSYLCRHYCKHERGIITLLVETADYYSQFRRELLPIILKASNREELHSECVTTDETLLHYRKSMDVIESAEWNLLALASALKGVKGVHVPAKFSLPKVCENS